jgi:hypothetical protein
MVNPLIKKRKDPGKGGAERQEDVRWSRKRQKWRKKTITGSPRR